MSILFFAEWPEASMWVLEPSPERGLELPVD